MPRIERHEGDNSGIDIVSGVSLFTGEPYVQMKWGEQDGQLTPDECRAHAAGLIEAAEAAEFDAIFWKWSKERLAATDERAGQILQDFRRYRERARR